jgi:DNA topoisomerase-3
MRPIRLAGAGEVILAMTDSGAVTDIPVPGNQQQAGARKQKRKWSAGTTGAPKHSPPSRPKDSAGAESAALGSCPSCGAEVREQKKSYSCSAWKEGCKFVIWKTIAGKRISARTAKTLLAKGQTGLLKGFKSKAGKPFDARLKLIDGQVRFDFGSSR